MFVYEFRDNFVWHKKALSESAVTDIREIRIFERRFQRIAASSQSVSGEDQDANSNVLFAAALKMPFRKRSRPLCCKN